jgi:hypothetical protein
MEPFANHVPFFFSPSRFDPHRFQEFSLRKMVKKQYLSLPPDTVSPISKFLYRQDFGSLASCVKTKEKILQKIDQKEKHKAENIDPLYPVGPPLSRTGHRYLFPQGPLTGNLPPGMKPMHWQLPSCKYYPAILMVRKSTVGSFMKTALGNTDDEPTRPVTTTTPKTDQTTKLWSTLSGHS